MKRYLLFFLWLAISLTSWTGGGIAYATEYIREIAAAASSSEQDAKKQLTDNGYKVVDRDLNDGAGGDYIYVGYKTSTNYEDAITNLIVSEGSSADICLNNHDYTMVKCLNGFNGDMNKGAGGKYIYLKYTKDKVNNEPALTNIRIVDSNKLGGLYVDGYKGNTLDYPKVNFNWSCDKQDYSLYMIMEKTSYDGEANMLLDYLDVEYLGARLYKFTIPVIALDHQNAVNSLSGDFDIYTSITQWPTIKLNCEPFYGEEFFEGDDNKIIVESYYGQVIDHWTMQPMENDYDYCFIEDGNHKNLRLATLLWLAPEDFDTNGQTFKFSGAVGVNAENRKAFTVEKVASLPKESNGMDEPTVMNPYINVEAAVPGWTHTMVISTNNMLSLGLVDVTAGTITSIPLEESTTSYDINIKCFEEMHEYVLMALIKKTTFMSDGKQDYGYHLSTVPFKLNGLRKLIKEDAKSNSIANGETQEDETITSGEVDGYRWVQLWKGGPKFMVADLYAPSQTINFDQFSGSDPATVVFSNKWRTVREHEVSDLLSKTRYYRTIYLENRYVVEFYGAADEYLHNYINLFSNSPYIVAKDSKNQTWEAFEFSDSGPKVDPVSLDGEMRILAVLDETHSDYVFQPTFAWKLKRPDNQDIIEDDLFMIERSYTKDFDDSEVIDNVMLGDSLKTNDQEYAHYVYTDEDALRNNPTPDSLSLYYFMNWENISQEARIELGKIKYPAHFTYYKVSRSFIQTIWTDNTDYQIGWQVLNTNILPTINQVELTKGKSYDRDRQVKLSIHMANPYPWELVSPADSADVHKEAKRQGFDHRLYQWNPNAQIKVIRYSPDDEHFNGIDEVEKTFYISGKEVKLDEKRGEYSVELEDYLSAPYTHYIYKAIIDTTDISWPVGGVIDYVSAPANEWTYFNDLAPVSDLQATHGTIQGQVGIEWETGVDANRTYTVAYRKYGSDDEWTPIDTISDHYFNENKLSLAGKAYEYQVIANAHYRGKEYHSEARTTEGYNPYYGTIAGKIKLVNGNAMPGGELFVNIKRITPFNVDEVKMMNSDNILMPALYQEQFDQLIKVQKDGSFVCDSVPYLGDSLIRYEVMVTGLNGVSFINATGTPGTITIDMDKDRFAHHNIDFTCNDVLEFTGQVLYNNSTIPVGEAGFTVNGVEMCDSNGKPITTSSDGNFSILIPKGMPVSLRVAKKGHTLVDDGYLIGNDSVKVIPTDRFVDKKVYDLTTIRLVGRIVGGNLQAKIPLGMGLGHNNLGDDMRMELKLEGDNTSNIVYYLKNPERETRDTTFTQTVIVKKNENEPKDTTEMMPTSVSFQRKRILLYPDTNTGEFCVDLFPTKYKITAISAKGYSSLTNEGEGFEVLDLTDCMDSIYVNNESYIKQLKQTKTNQDMSERSTAYQATYQRVYHVPATVTVQQYLKIGQTLSDQLGETTFDVNNLQGEKAEIKTVEVIDGKVQYAFGYPVFKCKENYHFRALAHEDYYYNNENTRAPEIVHLEGGHLTVYNGLESAKSKIEAELNKNGEADFCLNVDNPCFNLQDTAALRNVNVEVELNNYYYRSTPIRGFVLGDQGAGIEVMPLDEQIEIVDIVRDPYGTNSYAWRDKGTQYHWDKDKKTTVTYSGQYSLKIGPSWTWYMGFGMAEEGSVSTIFGGNINIPYKKNSYGEFGEYTMTLNERVETSADPMMQGAMADVYIGRVDITRLRETLSVSIIDSTSHACLQNAISTGAVKVIKEGIDSHGEKCWLAVGRKLVVAQDSIGETFAYSQKHILGTIIPMLEKRYSELVMHCSEADANQLAHDSQEVIYYEDEDGNLKMAVPYDNYTGRNEAIKIKNTIVQWRDLISKNEEVKAERMGDITSAMRHYSVSDQPLEFSENVEAYHESYDYWSPGGHVSGGFSFGLGDKGVNRDSLINKEKAKNNNDNSLPNDKQKKQEAMVFGMSVNLDLNPISASSSASASQHSYVKQLRNTGFKLDMRDNGYMDVDLYKEKGQMLLSKKEFNFLSASDDGYEGMDIDRSTLETGEYVFVLRGGAMRSPWFDADSSFVYTVSDNRVPLGERPKKIDNPKIYISNPVVSNIKRDDKALISVRLTNETEYNGDPTSLKPIPLMLRLADNCNPLGAKVMMDGAPITDGRKFQLKPGETLTKTIEVARGDGYDFDDLGLVFHDETLTLRDTAKFSVHYAPESSPVTLTLPKDQWVMNTLSDCDKETGKYYLPVEISGFDVNTEGFHHIELQYKKQTEGESQWVNLCSFYHDPDLYEKASGVKRQIDRNIISDFAFYGEKDPIEMRYDLRAVTFCQLGTGFITKSSNIASGIKDTRTPEVFGKPTPVNGILTYGDVISVPFNEPIAYNYLDRTANFSVRGFTNNSDANHSARLRFASKDDYAETKVKRSLKGADFTLEMNVQVDEGTGDAVFFSMEEGSGKDCNRLSFKYRAYDNILLAVVDSMSYGSEPLSTYGLNIHDVMTHVGMIYCADDQSLSFIAGNKAVPTHLVQDPPFTAGNKTSRISSQLTFGSMQGYMADVRLWQRELNTYEVENLYQKKLSGNETDLLAWWPMDEAIGNVVADHANGADLDLHGVSWETPKGFSAHLEGKPLEINPDIKLFQTAERQDFSLAFWFKVDHLDATQATDSLVDLFTAGTLTLQDKGQGKMRIGFDHNKLVLRTEGNTIDIGKGNDYVRNGQWHFLTLVTNHAENVASLFIDGQMVAETDAEKIGYITGTPVSFGSKGYHGYIDEVSMWHLALPQTYIDDIKTTALSGREKELNVYMSFETDELQGDNLMKTVFSPLNQKVSETTGQIVGDVMFDASTVGQEAAVHAPMKKDIGITNIDFTWTCTDNALQINLLKKDAEINNQRIDLVLRGVEDLQGNPMANPLMWSIYVDKNVLRWKDKTMKLDIPYGEGATITAPWQNISGRMLNYTVETGCHWLNIDQTMGLVDPMGESEVKLKVSNGMAPGSYNAIVNLIDEDGLVSKLYLDINVEATDPDWELDTSSKYAETMYITAEVLDDEANTKVIDTDERDIVAAFYNGICLGKANIQKKGDNSAFVYLTVHGDKKTFTDKLLFYLWDKSQGEIKRLKRLDGKDIHFCPDSIMGSHSDPVVLVYDSISIQTLPLKQGWNWISFNLKPGYTQGVNHLFLDNTVFSNGDIIKSSIGNTKMAEYSTRYKTWSASGNTMPLGNQYVYQVYVSSPCTVQFEGRELTDADRRLTFTREWCNLPYLLKTPMKVRRAMSDYVIGDKALPGTIIKGHDAFAVADVNGIWYGSLEFMRPGEGYFVNHLGQTCEVQFINSSAMEGTYPDDTDEEPTRAATGESIASEYVGAMPIIATFSAEDEVMEGDMLVAYAYGKEVGRAEASTLIRNVEGTDRNVYFLIVNAADGNAIRFAKERDGETLELTPRAIRFDASGIAGTLDHPFIIDFSPADDNEIFDIEGRHYTDDEQLLKQRVYIINGEKQMSK